MKEEAKSSHESQLELTITEYEKKIRKVIYLHLEWKEMLLYIEDEREQYPKFRTFFYSVSQMIQYDIKVRQVNAEIERLTQRANDIEEEIYKLSKELVPHFRPSYELSVQTEEAGEQILRMDRTDNGPPRLSLFSPASSS